MASHVRFADVRKLLEQHGWKFARVRGSHHYFTRPGATPISIPVHGGKVSHVYLKQAEKIIREFEAQRRKSEGEPPH